MQGWTTHAERMTGTAWIPGEQTKKISRYNHMVYRHDSCQYNSMRMGVEGTAFLNPFLVALNGLVDRYLRMT